LSATGAKFGSASVVRRKAMTWGLSPGHGTSFARLARWSTGSKATSPEHCHQTHPSPPIARSSRAKTGSSPCTGGGRTWCSATSATGGCATTAAWGTRLGSPARIACVGRPAPQDSSADLLHWLATYQREIGGREQVRHVGSRYQVTRLPRFVWRGQWQWPQGPHLPKHLG
jgi:hypothetical protein